MQRFLDWVSCSFVLALVLLGSNTSGASELLPAPYGVSARSIAERAENMLRSTRTYMAAEMTIVSPRLMQPRVVAFRSWEDRAQKRSFIRIGKPAKDEGTGFLKLHPNLWMYIPRVERTIRIPPSMMLQSWMGSDFTNDDLIRESSALDDYDHRLLGIDANLEALPGHQAYVVEYTPHEDAPVVWGKIVAWIEVEHGAPIAQEFYDEDGAKLRIMRFEDIRLIDGRYVPHRWSMTPLDKKGHETRIELLEIRFDAELDETIFTKRNLKKVK